MNGYNRCIGFETKHYFLNDTLSGLNGSVIQSNVFKDTNGLLWTSTYEKLCFFDPKLDKFKCFSLVVRNEPIEHGYHVFSIDNMKNLLYLRAKDFLIAFDTKTRKIKHILGETKGNWFTVENEIILAAPWMNSTGFEIWSLQKNNWFKKEIDISSCQWDKTTRIIKAFKENNNLWLVTTNQGIIKYNEKTFCKTYEYKEKQVVSSSNAIKFDNQIFISTSNFGALIFDMSTEKYLDLSKIEGENIYNCFVSSSGKIWLSNELNGVFSLPLQHLHKIATNTKTVDHWTKIQHRQGIKVFVDKDKGLSVEQGDKIQYLPLGSRPTPLKIIEYCEIKNPNEILLCDNNQCYLLNINTYQSSRLDFNEGKQFSDIKTKEDTLFYIADHKFYFTLFSTGLKTGKIYSGKYQESYQSIETLLNDIKSIVSNSTLLQIENHGFDTIIDVKQYIQKSIYDTKLKRHYVGTASGLFLVDSNYKVKKLPTIAESDDNQMIYHLIQDSDWIYYTEGNRVGRLNKRSNVTSYFYKNTYESPPSIMVLNDTIFIGNRYIEKYFTKDAFSAIENVSILLDEFLIHENPASTNLNIDNTVFLKHDENQLQFRFYLNDWEHSELSKIKYRIIPISNSWTTIKNGGKIIASYLNPGKYSIEVKGILADGTEHDKVVYYFTIRSPWYQTSWFRFFVVLTLIFAGYGIYKFRIGQLKEKFRIKNEITALERSALQAQMNPHFIFNCLNSIQNFIIRNDKELAMDYLGRFAKLIRLYLNASAQQLVSLEDEIMMLENYLLLEQLRFNNSFDFRFEMGKEIDASSIKLPPLLIQPFVENAVIHGMSSRFAQGVIVLCFSQNEDILKITIQDNGKGIKKQNSDLSRKSHGVSITQKRLAYINDHAKGNYDIQTESNENGTLISVFIKLS